MKKIIVRSGSLRMGGLEKVLIDFLKLLDLTKYKVFLFIEDDCGEENIFQKDIPEGIELYFLKDSKLIEKTKRYKESRKKSLYSKILYNIYMEIERLCVEKHTKEIIEKIEIKYGDIDLFIDYDWGATKYIEKLNIKKKIVWIHNSIRNLMKKPNKIERFGKRLNKYDRVITICNEMKDEVEELYPYLKGRVNKIYNPFDFEGINVLSEDETSLSQEDKELLKDDYIIAVSRLDTVQKDYDTLLKGFKLCKKSGLKEKLYIVGDGPNRKEIEELVKILDMQKDVIFLGRRKNPFIWMKNAQYFVHSSKYEGFGLVLVEAMSLGKCVISSSCKVGPKEILGNGKYGKLFEVGDINGLSEILINISFNSEERREYEVLGLERKNIFSGNIIKKEIEKLIEEVTK